MFSIERQDQFGNLSPHRKKGQRVMVTQEKSIEQFAKEQIAKWESMVAEEDRKQEARVPVITVSSEPGSGGTIVGREVSKRLGFDYFHKDIIEGIAKSAKIRTTVIETIEKERMSGIEDFISSLVKEHYIWPGIYLEHLLKVVSTIGKHGRAVIVGRGANFILPPEERFSVRVVAPLQVRVQNIARHYATSEKNAMRRVIRRESKRRAFIRQSFNADISDPHHYDLTVNTGKIGTDAAVEAIIGAVMGTLSGKSRMKKRLRG
jgi:cytidylate kinase